MAPRPDFHPKTGTASHAAATGAKARRWAVLGALGWAVLVIAYAAGFLSVVSESRPRGTVILDFLFFALVLALPVALFWMVALLASELARLRSSLRALEKAIPGLASELATTRAALAADGRVATPDPARAVEGAPSAAPREDAAEALAETREDMRRAPRDRGEARRADPRPAAAARNRAKAPPAPDPEPTQQTRPDWDVLVRALDFPRDAEDREGFRALGRAKEHGGIASTLRAAEDVLTLLAQVGVYVDDLAVTPAPASVWRRYITGTRGHEVAAVGGVTQPDALEAARALMESDPIFRDTTQHFLRRFDAILADFGAPADDAGLLELVDTRSGRAFMLLARSRGRFG